MQKNLQKRPHFSDTVYSIELNPFFTNTRNTEECLILFYYFKTDDKNGDEDLEGSFIDQNAVSSDSLICKNSSIAEVEISLFFFWKSMSQKRLNSTTFRFFIIRLLSRRNYLFLMRITKVFVSLVRSVSKETNHL